MSLIDLSGSEARFPRHVALPAGTADGADIVNTFTDKPATLLLGAGQLAPSLEQILIGLRVGDHSTFQLAPEQGSVPGIPTCSSA